MNKLSYPRAHRFRTRAISQVAALAIGGAGLVLFVLLLIRVFAPNVLVWVSEPLWRGGAALSAAAGNANIFESRANITAARDELAQANASLTVQNAALTAQVADLTALLGTRTQPGKGIVAGVLARPPVAPYDVLVIDQGTDAGIAPGDEVYGAGGTPIGTITEANTGSARTTLYSTRGLATDGWVGASRIPLTLTGAGAGAFTASILKDAGVAVGDGVYLAHNGAFPIGTVTNIESDPSSPTVVLDVHPYINPFSTTLVTVSSR